MALNYEKTLKRISAAEANKQRWIDLLDDCYDYFLPNRNTFYYENPGNDKQEKVFDSTAMDAISDYASRMESQLTPPGREWMKLEAGTEIPDEEKAEIEQLLEKNTKILFNHINSSNFSSQIQETYLDLGVSTGAIIAEEGNGIQSKLRFRAVPLANIILERSQRGIVETVWQRIKLQAVDILGVFPHLEGKLSSDLERIISDSPDADVEFIEGVQLNEDETTYTSMIIYEADKSILYEEELESSPWIVFREFTTPGETYGRGRAIKALPDVKTLNKVMQYYIESCELNGQPIYLAVDDGLINPHTIKIRPKTVIPVSSADTISPLPMAGSPELNIDLIQRLQDSVRRILLSKPFGQIDETPVRTATEMTMRNADLAQTTTSASGRIQTELLERLIARCVFILKGAGKMADMKVNGAEVGIKFTSPSARQQDEIDAAVLMRFMESLGGLLPEMINMKVKVEDMPGYLADILGVDKSLLRTPSESEAKQKELEAQRQAAIAASQGGNQ